MTTIVHETEKARFPSVFNGFTRIQKRRTFSLKIAQPLKIQYFISLSLKTPTIDIAPAKLHPYVKSKTQTQMHEFASCFCPYRLHPHDTLCTYGAKQLRFQGFSLSAHFREIAQAPVIMESVWNACSKVRFIVLFRIFPQGIFRTFSFAS
ncbi:MAG: hypothetical protein HP003_09840 [Oscillospiraceae bacterium]|nr:hypothetical protein [Oscillospiraceae bacterium]